MLLKETSEVKLEGDGTNWFDENPLLASYLGLELIKLPNERRLTFTNISFLHPDKSLVFISDCVAKKISFTNQVVLMRIS